MDNSGFLMAANAVVWIGVCAYLAFMGLKQKRTHQRVSQLELLEGDHRD